MRTESHCNPTHLAPFFSFSEFLGSQLGFLYLQNTAFAGTLPNKFPDGLMEIDLANTMITGGIKGEAFAGLLLSSSCCWMIRSTWGLIASMKKSSLNINLKVPFKGQPQVTDAG